MRHVLPLVGDFEIELEMAVTILKPQSQLCFLLNKKVGVLWGQTICKLSKRGSMRPYNKDARPDLNLFRKERKVIVQFVCKRNLLSVRVDGRRTDIRRFQKGDLDEIQFGILGRHVRFAITHLSIKGTVDTSKL